MTRLSLVLILLAMLTTQGNAAEKPVAAGVAVIELFTSQGCSSCPPADRLLSQLASDARYAGKVIPLSFHVDYWNYIGWTDPFSSADFSQRQRAYAQRAFRSHRVYTPQVVVNGREECVGSREDLVRAKVRAALAEVPAARVTIEPGPAAAGGLPVKVSARLARSPGPGDLELWVALYQDGLETRVGSGENASKSLHNDRVVRRFVKALTLSGAAGAEGSAEVTLKLDRGWKREALGVAAFLQDPKTLAIHGAAAKAL